MISRTRKPNISPIPEVTDAKTTADLYREHDSSLRNEEKIANENKERILAKNKIEEKRSNAVNSYINKYKQIETQKVDLKIKDLKELEEQIKEEILLQEKRKIEYVDEIFANGESLFSEIEEKRVKEKNKKSIFKKLINFLFGF